MAKGGRELPEDSEHGKLSRGIKSGVDGTKARVRKLADNLEWIFGRMAARVLGVLALFAVVVTLLLVFLNWYIAPIEPGDKKDLILALGQILAGTALLAGLYFTWRGQGLTQKGQEATQRNTQRQLQLTEQGQITERFTRAIDQLGATDETGEKLEIRLGGIYALERIDKESPKRAYHATVMEVLTAYVRENSRRDRGQSSTPSSADNEAAKQDKVGVEQDVEPTTLWRTPADIQIILDVLKRREEECVPEKHRVLLDLRGAILVGANLLGANLVKANLQEALLQEAFLLQGANLQQAELLGANLQDVALQDAKVTDAQLGTTSSLQGATLPDGSKYP